MVFHMYLRSISCETEDGEFIAIENEGLIDPTSQSVIKTKLTFNANNAGKYREFNHGVYVGALSSNPDVKDSIDIVVYKLN